LPSGIEASEGQNIGEFSMSQEFVDASKETLAEIYAQLRPVSGEAVSLDEMLSRLGEVDRILKSYLGAVNKHAESTGIPWFTENGSPLIKISASLFMRNLPEDIAHSIHVDKRQFAGRGMRFLIVNRDPTIVPGINNEPKQIVTLVYGTTQHSVPAIHASKKAPRLRIATDYLLDDPRSE
jgi:hypothetical protein